MNKHYDFFAILLLFFIFFIPAYPMPKDPGGLISPLFIVGLFYILILLLLKGGYILRSRKEFYIFSIIFAILILVDVIGIFIFSSPTQANYLYSRAIQFILLRVIVSFLYTYEENGLLLLSKVLAYSAFILSILIVLEGFSIISVGNETLKGRLYFGINLPFRKATGMPMSDGKLGTLLVPAFMLVLMSMKKNSALQFQNAFIILFVIGFGLLVSQSRSAWLGLFITLSLYTYTSMSATMKKYFIIVMSIPAILLLYVYQVPQKIASGLVSEGRLRENFENRSDSLDIASEILRSNPFFGYGKDEIMAIHADGSMTVIHNNFVEQLASTGLIGFIPLVLLYGIFFILIIQVLLSEHVKNNTIIGTYSIWLLLSMIHVVVELNLYRGTYNEYVVIYFSIFIYIMYKVRTINKQNGSLQKI